MGEKTPPSANDNKACLNASINCKLQDVCGDDPVRFGLLDGWPNGIQYVAQYVAQLERRDNSWII